MKSINPIKVGFVALGCPKNVVDSERMLAEIAQSDFLITPQTEDADVIVINTCGFIQPAKEEAFDTIKQAVKNKRAGKVRKVIVAGCLVERLGDEIFEQVKGIDAAVGLAQRERIAEVIRKTLKSGTRKSFLGSSGETVHDDRVRLRIGPEHWAYLKISEGCNHKCSFCMIPAIRGRFRSKSEGMILAEAKELVESGAVELNIIGQDTSYYGRDLNIKDGLAKLVGQLERVDGLKWIRLMYLYPAEVTEKLIESMARSEKVVHYADIPVQHINDEILRDMHRADTKDSVCRMIEKIREAMKDIVLRTTVIVGFPSETEEQFEELLEFINWARFDALGCFKYYRESGTPAAGMSNQVPEDIKEQRVKELMLAQQRIAFEKNKHRISEELCCIVDSIGDKNTGQGRFYGQAPEIDSICIIKNCTVQRGQFVNVKVVGTEGYDLVVEEI